MSSSLQNTSFISTSTHIITHITYYISKRAIRQVKFLILDEFNKTVVISFAKFAGTKMFIFNKKLKPAEITAFTQISDLYEHC